MNGLLGIQGVKKMARLISISFLIIHAMMIAIFWRCGVMPMALFNVGSIAFYALSFVLIQKELLGLYTDLVYLEVVAHMTSAVLLTGWGNDFQVALVGISAFAFFAEYLERYLNIRHTHALPLCVLGACAYLTTCAVSGLPDAQVCRWGGEEFLAVGLIGNDMESQIELLDRARRTIAGHSLWYEEHRICVTITLGVAVYENGYTTSEWINAADEKLYAGKNNGKNQVVV